jgi:ubiquinone/menaquinone biosynthesis C-methylase UbiE
MREDFVRAAASYDEVAVLAREVSLRMTARLDFVKLSPARVADIGCATGDVFFQVGWKATPQKVTVLLKEEGAAYHQPNRRVALSGILF